MCARGLCAQNYAHIAKYGAHKANQPALKIFLQGIQAGGYIGLGAFVSIAVAGTIPGVCAFYTLGLPCCRREMFVLSRP